MLKGWEIECTRWCIGRCVVFWSVQVGWFVGGVNECTFVGWWWFRCKSASTLGDRRGLWWKVSDACHQHAKVRVRWETDGVVEGV